MTGRPTVGGNDKHRTLINGTPNLLRASTEKFLTRVRTKTYIKPNTT